MKEFTAACVQIAVTPNEPQENINKSLVWLKKAIDEHQADLIVFPETVTTGFDTCLSPEDLWDSWTLGGTSQFLHVSRFPDVWPMPSLPTPQ